MRGRRDVGRAVAGALRRAFVDQRVEQGRSGHIDARLDLGAVDILAFAGPLLIVNRAQHGQRAVVGAAPVHVGIAPARRRMRGRQPRLFGQPADGLGNRTVGGKFDVGALIAPARLLDVDDIRLDLFQLLVTESPFTHGLGRKSFDDHIADGHDALEQLAPLGMPHVQAQALFAGVDIVEIPAPVDALDAVFTEAAEFHGPGLGVFVLLGRGKRRHVAQEVEPLTPLDTQNFRPQAGQQPWAAGAGQQPGQISHTYAF